MRTILGIKISLDHVLCYIHGPNIDNFVKKKTSCKMYFRNRPCVFQNWGKIGFIFLKLEAKHDTGRGIQHDITWCQETNRKKVARLRVTR